MPADVKQAIHDKKREKAKGYAKTTASNARANYKPTDEGDFFVILARTRPHICYITGTTIIGGIKPINCMHVLAKKQYPAWRLNPRNIVFGQAQCHVDEHSQPRSVLEAREGVEGEGWRRYFKLQDELKAEYNGDGKEFKFEDNGLTYTIKANSSAELNNFLDGLQGINKEKE